MANKKSDSTIAMAGSPKTFPERFRDSDDEAEKQKGTLNIQPKNKRSNNGDGVGEKQSSAFNI